MNLQSSLPSLARFITIEGIEGVGKSTAIKFLHQYLEQQGITHILTREPGGTEVAEAIRHILLTKHIEKIAIETELLLMFASRKQHIQQVIQPALLRREWVICDRFTDASYAYQGGGRGISAQHITYLEQWVQGDLRPDLVLLLDAPVEVGVSRMNNRTHKDRIESEQAAFFTRVRETYLQRAREFPERFCIIDASRPITEVREQLVNALAPFLSQTT